MFFQNDPAAPADFQHYACLFSCLLRSREMLLGKPWDIAGGVAAWQAARGAGFISGDLNQDGDFDDPGEDEIQKYAELFRFLGLPLREVPAESLGFPMGLDHNGVSRILPVRESLDLGRYWVIEAWRWKITHFVCGDGRGLRPVIYDPIRGGSLTVANGTVESLRVFEIVQS